MYGTNKQKNNEEEKSEIEENITECDEARTKRHIGLAKGHGRQISKEKRHTSPSVSIRETIPICSNQKWKEVIGLYVCIYV